MRTNLPAVKSLVRSLGLLEVLRLYPDGLPLTEIVSRTRLPKGTVHRLLATLVQQRFVEQTDNRYRIGIQAFLVGTAFLENLDLRARALPFLVALRNGTGETVQLGVLEDLRVVYVDRVLSQSPVAYMKSRVGAVLPAYCTALGKVLLAFAAPALVQHYLRTISLEPLTPETITNQQQFLAELELIRHRGYAVDRGEREMAVRCVAAPIFNHEGAAVAAVSIAGPAERMPWSLDDSPVAARVVEAARQISFAIGFQG